MSYVAFDDQDATFVIPSGGGFEIVFCPPGRSTTILSSKKDELTQLANTGHLTLAVAQTLNSTGKKSQGVALSMSGSARRWTVLAIVASILMGTEGFGTHIW